MGIGFLGDFGLGGEQSSAVPSLRSDQTAYFLYNAATAGANTESYTVPAGKKLYIIGVVGTADANRYITLSNDAGTIAKWLVAQLTTENVSFASPIVIESGDTFDLAWNGATAYATAIGWIEDAN